MSNPRVNSAVGSLYMPSWLPETLLYLCHCYAQQRLGTTSFVIYLFLLLASECFGLAKRLGSCLLYLLYPGSVLKESHYSLDGCGCHTVHLYKLLKLVRYVVVKDRGIAK
jgi:hypothetical protein